MSLFLSVFILTILLAGVTIFLLIRKKKYGLKPFFISLIAFAISLIIVIPLGNQPVVNETNEEANAQPNDTTSQLSAAAKKVLNEDVENDPTQEELNEELKQDAVRADFVELNVDNPPKDKKVFVDGEVSSLKEGALDEFIITSKEGNGNGMYSIQLANTTNVEFKEGDIVRVYGTVDNKNELGFPQIFGTILERHENQIAEEYSPNSPVITKAESDQIREGMSYEEVVKIIGSEGTLEKETKTKDYIHTAYKWENNDGSSAFIQFIDKNTGTPLVSDYMFTDLK